MHYKWRTSTYTMHTDTRQPKCIAQKWYTKHFTIFMLVVSHNLCFEMQCLFIYVNMQTILTLTVRFLKLDSGLNVQCFHYFLSLSHSLCLSSFVCMRAQLLLLYNPLLFLFLFPSPFGLCAFYSMYHVFVYIQIVDVISLTECKT